MKGPATNVALFVIPSLQFDTSPFDLYKRNFWTSPKRLNATVLHKNEAYLSLRIRNFRVVSVKWKNDRVLEDIIIEILLLSAVNIKQTLLSEVM
jgi:hypothetical protein